MKGIKAVRAPEGARGLKVVTKPEIPAADIGVSGRAVGDQRTQEKETTLRK